MSAEGRLGRLQASDRHKNENAVSPNCWWSPCNKDCVVLLTGDARQPLFSVIFSQSIYLCLSADFRHCKVPGNWRSVQYLKIVYHRTVGVRNVFPSALCTVSLMSSHCKISLAVKIADIGVYEL